MSKLKEASFYEILSEPQGAVRCHLCPHNCLIKPGEVGICRVRQNQGGFLYTLIYGRAASLNLDPIEKKPLYHFYPGSKIISLGTLGCNLSCSFCQNWSISQYPKRERVAQDILDATSVISSDALVAEALDLKSRGNIGISYTYNEPGIWFEFVYETAAKARAAGLKNVLVTNGFLNPEPWSKLLEVTDALNIDIKSMEEEFYHKLCKGKLKPVLENCMAAKKVAHIEITNLIIPGSNDRIELLQALIDWIADNLGADTPLHFSRYHPDYKFSAPPTDGTTLQQAYALASQKLRYVYLGNLHAPEQEATYCSGCKRALIKRQGFYIEKNLLTLEAKCPFCQTPINVIIK
jgi:pyruvate formate lyase activating enzyme